MREYDKMNDSSMSESYYNYISGKVKLREFSVYELNKWILEDAARMDVDEYLLLIFDLYDKNRLSDLDLSIWDCIQMIPSSKKDQKFYNKMFKINPVITFLFMPNIYKTHEICDEIFDIDPERFFEMIPDRCKTMRMCDIVYKLDKMRFFPLIPDKYKTKKMCDEIYTNHAFYIKYVPKEFLTQELCDKAFKASPRGTFMYIGEDFRTMEMYQEIFNKNPVLFFCNLPNKYKTREMCEDYFLKYPREVFEFIPYEFLTQEMCDKYFNFAPKKNFSAIPKKFITQEMCDEYSTFKLTDKQLELIPDKFKNSDVWIKLLMNTDDWEMLKRISDEMLNQEMCDIIVKRFPQESFGYIFNRFKTYETCKRAIIYSKDWRLIFEIPKDMLNQELCSLLFELNPSETFSHIPDEFKTKGMCRLVSKVGSYINISKIPKDKLEQDMCNSFFKRCYGQVFEYIPLEFRTKEMYVELLQLDIERYSKYVPRGMYTEDIIELVAVELKKRINKKKKIDTVSDLVLSVIRLYPSLSEVLAEDKFEELIKNELCWLVEIGGTVEKIAERYNVNISVISSVLEKMKETDYKTYEAIKDLLEQNQNRYFKTMVNDINKLGQIILSLGDLKIQFLSSEQKLKFAYLYNKYIHNSLESIYSFSYRKYANEYRDIITTFFKRILKYNYLIDADMSEIYIPDIKTVRFNNTWLKKYDRDKFFGMKNGVPTIESRYGKDATLLTLELEEKIIRILNEASIPLNDLIVKNAFKEYFKGTLDEYIMKFQEFDNEFVESRKNKRK